MPRRTVDMKHMSWTEVAEARDQQPVILLPIGTLEQHGPHMPIGNDCMVAEWVALRTAEQTNALVAPAINYGCSAVFRNFPGTYPVRPDTLANVLRDVCRATDLRSGEVNSMLGHQAHWGRALGSSLSRT